MYIDITISIGETLVGMIREALFLLGYIEIFIKYN